MAGILWLGDIGASKYYLNAWAIGNFCCPNVGRKSRILFEPNGLCQHYRIIHPKCSFDGKIIEGKKMLRELLAEETLGNLKKLSDMRTKKVRNLRS